MIVISVGGGEEGQINRSGTEREREREVPTKRQFFVFFSFLSAVKKPMQKGIPSLRFFPHLACPASLIRARERLTSAVPVGWGHLVGGGDDGGGGMRHAARVLYLRT